MKEICPPKHVLGCEKTIYNYCMFKYFYVNTRKLNSSNLDVLGLCKTFLDDSVQDDSI